jgi:hypothetical protein
VGKKWGDTDNDTTTKMTEVILAYSMTTSATRIYKYQPCWDQFWNEGEKFHNFIASTEKSRVGFVKPSNVIRYAAFSNGSARSLGYCLQRHGLPQIVAPNGFLPLELDVICDTDIQGEENIATLKFMWTEYQSRSRMKRELGVEPKIRGIELKTEQDEPLLLAADLVAGCFQWYLGRPEVPLPDRIDESHAEKIIREFQGSGNFVLTQDKFHLTYQEVFGDLLAQNKS